MKTGAGGFALIAVLVVLSVLLALATPFALSMGRGEAVTFHQVDEMQVDWGSASVRDRLLSVAARGHPSVDQSVSADGLDEYPSRLELPEAFAGLAQGGQLLLAGEVWDLQRKLNLNSASPLLLANLLDVVARLGEQVPPDGDVLVVDRADGFPEEGFLLVDGELIHYGARTDKAFTNLSRGLLSDLGYRPADGHTLPPDKLVLDYRTVLAVTWPFDERHGGPRDVLLPYTSVGELARIGEAGFGSFTTREMDRLTAHGTLASDRQDSASWGRGERVFNNLRPPTDGLSGTRILRVRSGFHLGAGSVVRIRSLQTGALEYGLVISTQIAGATDSPINLPAAWHLQLLKPVTQEFSALDTVVEPLVPHAVNINTAGPEVLTALMREIRGARFQRLQPGEPHVPFPRVSLAEARELARRIIALRGGTDSAGPDARPFDSFEDLFERLFKPLLGDADDRQRTRLTLVYRNMRMGRDAAIDMGTAPICFTSGVAVGYRAAAAYQRSRVARSTAARMERRGIAAAMPGHALDVLWADQQTLEEALRLDRNAPWYLTRPINTSAIRATDRGTDPAPRYFPHLMAEVYPERGFGQARFPSRDDVDAGFRSAPASAVPGNFQFEGSSRRVEWTHEGFFASLDPEGRDVSDEGPYEMLNRGPLAGGVQGVGSLPPATAQSQQRFSFSAPGRVSTGGVTSRHAVGFWITLRDLGDQMIYELSADDAERNRISVQILEGELLFEVLDEAGLDPEPSLTDTSPERTAGTWRIPVRKLDLRPEVPVHLNFSAFGNQPGQLSLLVDGVRRGDRQGDLENSEPDFTTYLTRAVDPYEYDLQSRLPPEDTPRFVDLHVVNAESFPAQGVLRIGLELFEYTSRTGQVFHCEYLGASPGGRTARMSLWEYSPELPTRKRGEDGDDMVEVLAQLRASGAELDLVPAHPMGAAVQLYGYSIPLYRDTIVQVGDARLSDALGPFAVARMINRDAETITVGDPRQQGRSVTVGVGLLETTVQDIELGDPLPSGPGERYPPPPAEPRIATSFPAAGGYALLVQVRRTISFQMAPGQPTLQSETIGGVEVIRYGARQGNRLTGIQRGVALPGVNANDPRGFLTTVAKKFVSDWNPSIRVGAGGGTPMREVPTLLLYVVPISIAISGGVTDPSLLGYSEWVQIYPAGDEASTEWVRYNQIMNGLHLVRADWVAWERTRFALTRQTQVLEMFVGPLGGTLNDPAALVAAAYGQPEATSGYIGYVDQIEEDFPPIRVARQALGFRGDPFTDTSSHSHPAGSAVLPVHRLEMNPGNYGGLWGRAGRNDRVALVSGSRALDGLRPAVEWHSVNWTARRATWDRAAQTGQPIGERLGSHPFQLVAFKERVGANLFAGAPDPEIDRQDRQFVDRLVKFPSGELPGAYSDRAIFGGSQKGTIDELVAVEHVAEDLLLDEPMEDSAQEFRVRTDLELFAFGPLVGEDATRDYPDTGGLVAIDGEILAYSTRDDNGLFTVAVDGRGLLNTEPRAHDQGARVRFLTHVPAAILTDGISALDHQLVVDALGTLPLWGGTLLVGRQELLHYTWSRGSTVLEMPRWFDPDRADIEGRGLFRARYGTGAVGAGAGEVVILFPFRYWDRHHPRADDPELAYFQLTHGGSAPVVFTQFSWQEEIPDANVDLHALLRVDRKGSFAGDPEQNPDLMLFTAGDDRDRALQLFRQGSIVEARFFTVYRAGAFDPVDFLAHGWKTAPLVRAVMVGYEGNGRIFMEDTGR